MSVLCERNHLTRPSIDVTTAGEKWYTISSPELAREVLLPRDDTYEDRFIPGPMLEVREYVHTYMGYRPAL